MLEQLNESLAFFIEQTQANAHYLMWIVLIPWVVFVFSSMERRILYLGIVPRRLFGLVGIFFAPFLHANFNHIFFNSIPLLVLSDFILMDGLAYFIVVTVMIGVISGALIWGFAKHGLYIGASAVITGYWALLVSDIYQQGTLTAIILGVVCVYYFAGIFFSIFPSQKGVAWSGHLFGLLAGLVTSYVLGM